MTGQYAAAAAGVAKELGLPCLNVFTAMQARLGCQGGWRGGRGGALEQGAIAPHRLLGSGGRNRALTPLLPCPIQDMAPGGGWSQRWLLDDGLHFNAAGQDVVFKCARRAAWRAASGFGGGRPLPRRPPFPLRRRARSRAAASLRPPSHPRRLFNDFIWNNVPTARCGARARAHPSPCMRRAHQHPPASAPWPHAPSRHQPNTTALPCTHRTDALPYHHPTYEDMKYNDYRAQFEEEAAAAS